VNTTGVAFALAAAWLIATVTVVIAVFIVSRRPPAVDAATELTHLLEEATAAPACPSRFLDHHCTRTDLHTTDHNHHERLWWATETERTDTP
jgi:hypothetical protein